MNIISGLHGFFQLENLNNHNFLPLFHRMVPQRYYTAIYVVQVRNQTCQLPETSLVRVHSPTIDIKTGQNGKKGHLPVLQKSNSEWLNRFLLWLTIGLSRIDQDAFKKKKKKKNNQKIKKCKKNVYLICIHVAFMYQVFVS